MDADLFLQTAGLAETLIGSDAVAARWDAPSALEGYTVGGLAGHLARAVFTVDRYLDEEEPTDAPRIDAAEYFARALASHDPVTSSFHARVRDRGAQEAADGQDALLARLREARPRVAERLAAADPARPVAALDGAVLRLDEYLDTRLLELVVHLDDLAVSVGADRAEGVADQAYEAVAVVLARIAARRLDPLSVVRSLARRERHPEAVRAL